MITFDLFTALRFSSPELPARVDVPASSTVMRNCDMFTNYNDAMRAFELFVRQQGKLGFINPYTEAFKWLFAPATAPATSN